MVEMRVGSGENIELTTHPNIFLPRRNDSLRSIPRNGQDWDTRAATTWMPDILHWCYLGAGPVCE